MKACGSTEKSANSLTEETQATAKGLTEESANGLKEETKASANGLTEEAKLSIEAEKATSPERVLERLSDLPYWVCGKCAVRNGNQLKKCFTCSAFRDSRDRFSGKYKRPRGPNKAKYEGTVVSHVPSPTCVYLRKPENQVYYSLIKNFMAQTYEAPFHLLKYRPVGLITPRTLYAIKLDDHYERVRTDEKRIEGEDDETVELPLALEWHVQLIDRGDSMWVRESRLSMLVGDLAVIPPQAQKLNLNELRLKDVAEDLVEESRRWLESKVKDAKVTAEIIQAGSSSFVDLYVGESYLNKEICELRAVEPKVDMGWKKPEVAAPAAKDPPAQATIKVDPPSVESAENGAVLKEPVRQERSPRGRGGRGGFRGGRRQNMRPRNIPALEEWAAISFDPWISQIGLKFLCDMIETPVGTSPRQGIVSAPDCIRVVKPEKPEDIDGTVEKLVLEKPKLLLLLVVLPSSIGDYSAIEKAGTSRGVCVVCVRGEDIMEMEQSMAMQLRRDLQVALQNSPCVLPNDRRRGGYGQRGNNRGKKRGAGAARNGQSEDGIHSGKSLVNASTFVVDLLNKISKSAENSNVDEQEINEAFQCLEELTVNYRRSNTHTPEALKTASSFFARMSVLLQKYQGQQA